MFVGDAQGTIDMVTTVSGPRWSVRGAPEVRYPNCMGTWVVNFNLLAATAPLGTMGSVEICRSCSTTRSAQGVRFPNRDSTSDTYSPRPMRLVNARTRFAIDESQASFAVLCSQPIL